MLTGAEPADEVLGTWLMDTGKHRAHIDISREGDQYEGRISWLEEPTYPANDRRGMPGEIKVDRDNPDRALRDRPLVGLTILKGVTYDGDSRWSGTIYAPDQGKTYKAKLHLTEEGVLKVRGYIGITLLGRTMNWTRPGEAETSEGQ
jgi:uncharacterized protein (DUF2147 family)